MPSRRSTTCTGDAWTTGANGLTEVGWDLRSDAFRRTVGELAGDIAGDLEGISDVVLVSLDGIVADNVRKTPPKSADALFIGDGTVTFVEFKKWPRSDGDGMREEDADPEEKRKVEAERKMADMKQSVQMKAAESIHIFRRFLDGPDTEGFRTRFILVWDNPVTDYRNRLGGQAHPERRYDMSSPDFIRKYKVRDRSDSAVFYDEALVLAPAAFEHLMEKAYIAFPPQPRYRSRTGAVVPCGRPSEAGMAYFSDRSDPPPLRGGERAVRWRMGMKRILRQGWLQRRSGRDRRGAYPHGSYRSMRVYSSGRGARIPGRIPFTGSSPSHRTRAGSVPVRDSADRIQVGRVYAGDPPSFGGGVRRRGCWSSDPGSFSGTKRDPSVMGRRDRDYPCSRIRSTCQDGDVRGSYDVGRSGPFPRYQVEMHPISSSTRNSFLRGIPSPFDNGYAVPIPRDGVAYAPTFTSLERGCGED